MKDFKLSGEDPILIFYFFSRLVQEADTLDMSEGKPMVGIPHMFTKTATFEYRSTSSVNRVDGLSYWPEAVQYFLPTYATKSKIR